MHLKRLLGIFGLATTIALGAGFSLIKNNKQDTPIETKAAGSSVTLYVNHFDAGSDKGGVWSNFKYYLFGSGGNNGWPGQSFEHLPKTSTPNEYDQYQYVLTIDTSKYQSLVLTGNSDSTWSGAFAKTEDFSLTNITSANNGLYCGAHKGWQTDANVFAVDTYSYTTKTIYMLDLKGDVYDTKHYCHTWADGKNGTTWPGVEMTKVAGQNNLYSIEINSVLGNVIFNNNDTNQTATINSIVDGDAFILYPDNGYNKLNSDAASFIDKYMKFETKWTNNEGDGSCKSAGWYEDAKEAYNSRTEAQRSKILEHEPTQYRLAAWAKANGDTLNGSNVLSSSPRINQIAITSNNSALPIILVVISIIGITAAGGYYFLRKNKKEEN